MFLDRVSKNTQISNFMKIRPVGAKLFHADRRRRTDRHKEANSRILQFCECAQNEWFDLYEKCTWHPAEQYGRGHTILTSRELMWCYACSWDVRCDLPLNSTAQIHTSGTLLTSRDLTRQHASHISVVAHISWGELTWREDSVSSPA